MRPELPSASATVMQNAHYFVHLANAVYEPDPQDYQYFDDFHLENYKLIESDDGVNVAIAARLNDFLIVAVRGSDDIEDWWHNFQFKQVEDDYHGWVHSGFYEASDSIWVEVKKHLRSLWRNGDSVWIAGHSLGGAIATLFVEWLNESEYPIAGVHTFGQPRVGDNDFADHYPAPNTHYRFVNEKDIVPQVPYRWMGPGIHYKHVGKVYHFDEDGELSRSDKEWDDLVQEFAASTLIRAPMPRARMPDFGFSDHRLINYIKKIEGYLNS